MHYVTHSGYDTSGGRATLHYIVLMCNKARKEQKMLNCKMVLVVSRLIYGQKYIFDIFIRALQSNAFIRCASLIA